MHFHASASSALATNDPGLGPHEDKSFPFLNTMPLPNEGLTILYYQLPSPLAGLSY